MNEQVVREKYNVLTKLLIDRGLTITTMESITAGQIASLITDTAGASSVLKGAYVTYSNEAKIMQGVRKDTIEQYGVYSQETAIAMALSCRNSYNADIGIGITGSTGNVDPNNIDSVPGQVYYAIAYGKDVYCECFMMSQQKSRFMYKLYAAEVVVDNLLKLLNNTK